MVAPLLVAAASGVTGCSWILGVDGDPVVVPDDSAPPPADDGAAADQDAPPE